MGCVQSSGSSSGQDHEAKARNDEIEAQLRRDRLTAKNEIKMLLLGAGESGKSTILKQMKILHHGGFTDADRRFYKEIIFSNTVQSMRAILDALDRLGITLDPSLDAPKTLIGRLPNNILEEYLPRDITEAIESLWLEPSIKGAIVRSNEFQLNDSAAYYFDSVGRMSSRTYSPTDQDILRSRVKTTGITEVVFPVDTLMYRIFDVGGQRSERRKWIHCFENLTAIIFMVSLSEYDQVLREDEEVNRMQESLALFESICNSRWFVKTAMILFLNKTDIFAQKVKRSPVEHYFPDFVHLKSSKDKIDARPVSSGSAEYESGCRYFRKRFTSLNRSQAEKPVYTHFTCATDTQQVKFVLAAIHDILVKANLRDIGLM